MKKSILSTLILLILFSACETPQIDVYGDIYGIISDGKTYEPVKGASVILSPGNISTTTGSDGHYEFTDLEAGQYKVQVQANNYVSNTRQITVVAGKEASGDILLSPVEKTASFDVSATTLNFDKTYTELILEIFNTGNSGTINYTITGVDADWLAIDPTSGSIDMGKSASVKVSVDRSKITKDENVFITVNAAGHSKSILVKVSAAEKESYIEILPSTTLDFGKAETAMDITLKAHNKAFAYTAKIEDCDGEWLNISKTSGTIPDFEANQRTETITVTANRNKMPDIEEACVIVISAGDEKYYINVSIEKEAYIEISPSANLDFGLTETAMDITLKAHNKAFAYTAKIEDCDGEWLNISKTSGTIPDFEANQRTETITLTAIRKKMPSTEESCIVIITAGTDTYRLFVSAQKEKDEEDNNGGNDDNDNDNDNGGDNGGDETPEEDYSSATIVSCDPTIVPAIVDCKRSGTTVTFNYTLQNNGDYIAMWWMYRPGYSWGGSLFAEKSLIYDNLWNEYPYSNVTMTFRTSSQDHDFVYSDFPSGLPCKGSITIQNVSEEAASLTFIISVSTNSRELINHEIRFKDVPIY